MMYSLSRKLTAEFLGTALLVVTVVGSGIMADQLSDDEAVSLLGNTIPTGAILVVLITLLGPISGAHFNPAVSLVFYLKKEITAQVTLLYIVMQCLGGLLGTILAHAMFELDLFQLSTNGRTGGSQWIAEVVATFGLVFSILAAIKFRVEAVPWIVGLYITAAYWFTASTSFANPAVAIARSFTDTFSGIMPSHMPGFIMAEIVGSVLALYLANWLLQQSKSE